MLEDFRVRRRVRRNLAESPLDLRGADRVAGRWLFSILAALEGIAVEAARRGDGVRGQLVDELSHAATFETIARWLGGPVEPPDEVSELVDYLEGLEGAASLAALNVVAEHWLAGVFRAVSGWGFANRLFELIGSEEERHVAGALQRARPTSAESREVVARLEEKLAFVANSPAFLLPLSQFGGASEVARL